MALVRPISESDRLSWDLTWDADTSTATVVSTWGWIGGIEDGNIISTELVMRPGYASVTRRNIRTGEVTFTAGMKIQEQCTFWGLRVKHIDLIH